jgi:hypothetical protein
MFIRWKRRKKAVPKPGRTPHKRSNAGDSLYCVLVESARINGSPRQKVVRYLASVDENDCDKLWLRVDFWDYVSAQLDRMPLARRERVKIEESINRVVSRVPPEEAAAFKKARKEYQQKRAELLRHLEIVKWLGL